jgi:hypothetical protein
MRFGLRIAFQAKKRAPASRLTEDQIRRSIFERIMLEQQADSSDGQTEEYPPAANIRRLCCKRPANTVLD